MHLLINDTAQVKIGENTVTLIGLDGKPADFERYGGEAAMERSGRKPGYRICMAHVPTYFPERLAEYSFDLGLAGHTHGGGRIGPRKTSDRSTPPRRAYFPSMPRANIRSRTARRSLSAAVWETREIFTAENK